MRVASAPVCRLPAVGFWLLPVAMFLAPVLGAVLVFASPGLAGSLYNLNGVDVRPGAGGQISPTGVQSGNVLRILDGMGPDASEVNGGYSFSNEPVRDNRIDMTGGAVTGNLVGGYSSATASGNTVTISGGTVSGNVVGGWSRAGDATGNVVDISGGTVLGHVLAGSTTGFETRATGNTVRLSGNPVFGADTAIYGGGSLDYNPLPGDLRTGNTLAVFGSGHTLATVGNFSAYRFIIPANHSLIRPMLTLTSPRPVDLTDGGKPTTFDVALQGGGRLLTTDERLILVHTPESRLIVPADLPQFVLGQQGFSVVYDLALRESGQELAAVVTSVTLPPPPPAPPTPPVAPTPPDPVPPDPTPPTPVPPLPPVQPAPPQPVPPQPEPPQPEPPTPNPPQPVPPQPAQPVRVHPQTANLLQARSASLSTLLLGADLASGSGLLEARRAAEQRQNGLSGSGSQAEGEQGRWAPFATFTGGEVQTGSVSRTVVDGFAYMAGLAAMTGNPSVQTLGALFFEGGTSRYAARTALASGAIHGRGDVDYHGGGVLARLALPALGGLYAEGGFRAGRLSSTYTSHDLLEVQRRDVRYRLGSGYLAAHGTVGRRWAVSEALELDVYTRYLWTRLGGQRLAILDDPYVFSALSSHRLRSGGRVTLSLAAQVACFAGAAYEFEFSGAPGATAYGLDVPAPSVRGGTVLVEAGLRLARSADSASHLTLGVQGLAGKRRGMAGTVQAGWQF